MTASSSGVAMPPPQSSGVGDGADNAREGGADFAGRREAVPIRQEAAPRDATAITPRSSGDARGSATVSRSTGSRATFATRQLDASTDASTFSLRRRPTIMNSAATTRATVAAAATAIGKAGGGGSGGAGVLPVTRARAESIMDVQSAVNCCTAPAPQLLRAFFFLYISFSFYSI